MLEKCESRSIMSDSDPKNSPGQNTGVGSLSLLQGIFSTQESSWGLSHYGADSLPAEPPGKPWEMLSWAIMLLSNAEQQETRAFSPSFQGKSKSVRKGDRGTTLWACFSRGDGQIKLFDRTCWTAGQNNIPSHDTCFNLPWCFLSLSLDDTPGTTRAPASPSLLGDENLLVPAKCGFISVTENPTQGHHQKTPVQGFPGGSVIKNPPANARDLGLIPGLGRSHMLQSNSAMHHTSERVL